MPIFHLLPHSSKSTLHFSACNTGDEPSKYLSFISWHNVKCCQQVAVEDTTGKGELFPVCFSVLAPAMDKTFECRGCPVGGLSSAFCCMELLSPEQFPQHFRGKFPSTPSPQRTCQQIPLSSTAYGQFSKNPRESLPNSFSGSILQRTPPPCGRPWPWPHPLMAGRGVTLPDVLLLQMLRLRSRGNGSCSTFLPSKPPRSDLLGGLRLGSHSILGSSSPGLSLHYLGSSPMPPKSCVYFILYICYTSIIRNNCLWNEFGSIFSSLYFRNLVTEDCLGCIWAQVGSCRCRAEITVPVEGMRKDRFG